MAVPGDCGDRANRYTMCYSALDDSTAPILSDSGGTTDELDAIFDALATGSVHADPEEAFVLILGIGLTDGDVVELAESGTVMLQAPRAQLDRHVAVIKTYIANGLALWDSVEKVLRPTR